MCGQALPRLAVLRARGSRCSSCGTEVLAARLSAAAQAAAVAGDRVAAVPEGDASARPQSKLSDWTAPSLPPDSRAGTSSSTSTGSGQAGTGTAPQGGGAGGGSAGDVSAAGGAASSSSSSGSGGGSGGAEDDLDALEAKVSEVLARCSPSQQEHLRQAAQSSAQQQILEVMLRSGGEAAAAAAADPQTWVRLMESPQWKFLYSQALLAEHAQIGAAGSDNAVASGSAGSS